MTTSTQGQSERTTPREQSLKKAERQTPVDQRPVHAPSKVVEPAKQNTQNILNGLYGSWKSWNRKGSPTLV